MIVTFDKNPHLTEDQKIDSLARSVQLALNEKADKDTASQTFVDKDTAAQYVIKSALLDMVYPVGSYYETSDAAFDPNTAWGGTWQLETEGQVHISAGTTYTVDGALTDTTDGGSEYIQAHTHGFTAPSYTTAGAGSHNHVPATANRVFVTTSDDIASGNFTRHSVKPGSGTAVKNLLSSNTVVGWGTVTNTVAAHSHTVNHTSGTGSVNAVSGATTGQGGNMPPYIIVNRWHRTA